ncbi:hypothetical protein [Rhodococcoides corynebacterioides]|uniref:DUF8176 domain-containing protein n=1 Tax=Rhodococcoides corynebacterioides TaxID=53972 RepID=A0ABS7P217_9NOCA|nr:hypothetical protein [Rhodococcus corynebacterioides]MBY6366450.1 hypothetical protein [Rhodococcus corynebacterioides]MBY6407050.1 hypothetical protein [Rhodococcus corynebacterioides]
MVAGLGSAGRSGRGDGASTRSARGDRADRGVERVLAGPLPLRQRVVIVDPGHAPDAACRAHASDAARSVADPDAACRVAVGLADAIARHRPGSVVLWHPADDVSATLALGSDGFAVVAPDGSAVVAPSREVLRPRRSGVDEVVAGRAARPLTSADVAAAAATLSAIRQTVVVRACPDEPWFGVLADDADAVVVPVLDEDAVSRAIALTAVVAARRITVIRPTGSADRSTDVRRRLGEAGIGTVLDVGRGATTDDTAERSADDTAERSDDVAAEWSRAASVILRPRPTAGTDAPVDPATSFEDTTATLRARSTGDRRRVGRDEHRRRPVGVTAAAAIVALVVGLGAAVAVSTARGDGPPVSARTDAASATSGVESLDGPGVIARFDDLYYRDRDAAAAAALWELPAGVDRASMVADLEASIDAVERGTTHRLDLRPTVTPDVYDALLTLTTPDGRRFDYDQQFTVRRGADGYTIVRKIECSAPCSATTDTTGETGR